MSFKIRLEAPGLIMQAQLNDDALGDVITLIQKNRIEDVSLPTTEEPVAAAGNHDKESAVRELFIKHAPAEILNSLKWETYPDKILLLGAFHETRGNADGWRSSDIIKLFAEAKEPSPGNFPRDISKAIKSGDIRPVTPRSYAVSRTGWNRLADALEKIGAI